MKKYNSFKYINEKSVNISEIGAEIAQMALQSVAGPAMYAGVNAGLGVAFSAAGAIKNIYNKYKYDKHGCDNIIDPNKRNECESRQIDRIVSGLRTQLRFCKSSKDPQECTNKINAEIEENLNKKREMLQTYYSPEQQ